MPIRNEWLEGIWDNAQTQKGVGLVLWIPSFVLLRWPLGRLGMAEEVVGAYGALMALVAAAMAIAIMQLIERLLFGHREKGKLATWLKVVVGLGLVAAIALAVWVGREGYRSDHPKAIARDPVFEKLKSDPDVQRGMAAMEDIQRLKAEREKKAAATKP